MHFPSPPFSKGTECYRFGQEDNSTESAQIDPPLPPVLLPAVICDRLEWRQLTTGKTENTSEDAVIDFLKVELDVSALNRVHKHLWLAGQERPLRALHEHRCMGREVKLTENANWHLLWQDSQFLVKPCPDFLLSHGFWTRYLCTDQPLYENALGMLLSYIILVRSRTDFQIAVESGVLPQDSTPTTSTRGLSWAAWTQLSAEVLSAVGPDWKEKVNPRYRYGELRLHRINWIYRLCSKTRDFNTFFRGFRKDYYDYTTFFRANVAWITVVTVYIALVLTAMQVGLSLDVLKGSRAFRNASYGFTVFSIVGPIASLAVLIIGVMGTMAFLNLNYTLKLRRNAEKRMKHDSIWKSSAISKWKH